MGYGPQVTKSWTRLNNYHFLFDRENAEKSILHMLFDYQKLVTVLGEMFK